jgi:hypothetical protein
MYSDMLCIDFLDEAALELSLAQTGLPAEFVAIIENSILAINVALEQAESHMTTRKAADQAQTDAYIKARRAAGISMIR